MELLRRRHAFTAKVLLTSAILMFSNLRERANSAEFNYYDSQLLRENSAEASRETTHDDSLI